MEIRPVVLVLSGTVLGLEELALTQTLFDEERLDTDRLAIDDVASSSVPSIQSVADVRTTRAAAVGNLSTAANSPHPVARVPTMFQTGDVGDAFPGCIVRRDRMAESLVLTPH